MTLAPPFFKYGNIDLLGMKKIMFNDKYGLTDAVLRGTKTQTRRLPSPRLIEQYNSLLEEYKLASKNVGVPCSVVSVEDFLLERAPYKVGEVVAVAQNYKDAGVGFEDLAKDPDILSIKSKVKGYSNKMYVKPKLMPHQVKITNVRVQRLQDITDEECMLEGIREVEVSNNWGNSATHTEYTITYYNAKGLVKQLRARTPREAYALLIDKISGKGTWESNPWVWAYDFELLR
ncbi:hypothetical protein IX306_000655 [Porphyromonas levii]|nr:hypothetical protein [Porphyromonas levii]MBR8801774.1 hypothetical protein [Porphyromonas levii]